MCSPAYNDSINTMQSQATKNGSSQGSSGTSSHPPKRAYIGLSGGVDSSVSAALLKNAGYDVTGVFIKVWQPDWIECTWKEDRRDAMRVCAILDILFVTLDLEKEYKKEVIDYMIEEYSKGRTPNPDVMCNKSVKFGAFYDWAMKQGADYVATGHYARVGEGRKEKEEGESQREDNKKRSPFSVLRSSDYSLLAGNDTNKDQSYFLWNIKTEQLPHMLFPIGHLEKSEVRKLAAKFDLPTAEKKDSQGLCFIGKIDVKEFLSTYIKQKPGNVLNAMGEIVGNHPGALLFTIGERHGFFIDKKTPHDGRFFVTSKDTTKNTITVSSAPSDEMGARKMIATISSINIINKNKWAMNAKLKARIRYRQPLQEIILRKFDDTTATVEFATPQPTLTPGQSLVMYDSDECIGGGIID